MFNCSSKVFFILPNEHERVKYILQENNISKIFFHAISCDFLASLTEVGLSFIQFIFIF